MISIGAVTGTAPQAAQARAVHARDRWAQGIEDPLKPHGEREGGPRRGFGEGPRRPWGSRRCSRLSVLPHLYLKRETFMPLKFHYKQLSNGLDIVAEENPDSHSFAAGLFVKT